MVWFQTVQAKENIPADNIASGDCQVGGPLHLSKWPKVGRSLDDPIYHLCYSWFHLGSQLYFKQTEVSDQSSKASHKEGLKVV